MPGVRSIAVISVKTTVLSSKRNLSGASRPLAPLFVTYLLFIIGKTLLDQNDVEYDFRIGHVLEIFRFL